MIGTLYRYSHPHDVSKFIYVGQGSDRDKNHRIGKGSFGRRFKVLFPRDVLPKPVKEQIIITNQLELNEEEIIWMFRYHTWQGYLGGMNLMLPGSQDYKAIGRIGGLIGGHNGGRRRCELYGAPGTKESRAKGGRNQSRLVKSVGGSKGAHKRNKLHGNPATPESRRKAGLKRYEIYGNTLTLEGSARGGLVGGPIGMCKRWNINRNKPCVCGRHSGQNAI
jgi:hypothetical protein